MIFVGVRFATKAPVYLLIASAVLQLVPPYPLEGAAANAEVAGQVRNVSQSPGDSVLPAIAVDAGGTIHLAWTDKVSDELQIMYSWYGGTAWSPPVNVSKSALPSLFASIAVDGAGVVHLVWMEGRGNSIDVFYSRLVANEWSKPRNLSRSHSISERPQIVVDAARRIHIAWFENADGSFNLFHSVMESGEWSAPANTRLMQWYITDDPGFTLAPALGADTNGNVYVAWTDIYDSSQQIFYSRWNRGTWSPREVVSDSRARRPRDIRLVADGEGALHLIWVDQDEIWYIHSYKDKWLAPNTISKEILGPSTPSLCLSSGRHVHAAWSGMLFSGRTVFYRSFDGNEWSNTKVLAAARGDPEGVVLAFQEPDTLHVAWVDDELGNIEVRHLSGSPNSIGAVAGLEPQVAKDFHGRGVNWLKIGQPDKAIEDFDKAIALDASSAQAYDDRAAAWYDKGDWDQAIRDYSEAILRNAGFADAYNDRGSAWYHRGELDLAIRDYSAAIDRKAVDAGFFYNRGNAWVQKKEYERAIDDYEASIRIDPAFERSLGQLAWLLSSCPVSAYRDGERAVSIATRACELTHWRNNSYIAALAAAYAQAGQFEKAVSWQAKVRDMASPADRPRMQALLDLYEAGERYPEDIKMLN